MVGSLVSDEKVVVIIIMVAISLLFIYMSFLLCLDPIMNQNAKSTGAPTTAAAAAASTTTSTGRASQHYQRQINEEIHLDNPNQECVFSEPAAASGLQNSRQRSSTVLNLVTHEQSKWRKQVIDPFFRRHQLMHLVLPLQVQQQRQSVYSRHDLLN